VPALVIIGGVSIGLVAYALYEVLTAVARSIPA
jgi:hypothetical protein